MGIFQEVRLTWDGKERSIPADQVLPVIAAIEDVITLGELLIDASGVRAPLAKIAMAYAIALRYAGFNVTAEDVYFGMFGNAGADMSQRATAAVLVLHNLMVPPEHMLAAQKKVEESEGKALAAERAATDTSQSTSSTNSSSVMGT